MEENIIPQLLESVLRGVHSANGHWRTYPVGEDLIAKRYPLGKIYPFNGNAEKTAQHEYGMGTFLFDKGINVPKMHGIISPRDLLKKTDYSPEYHSISKDWFLIMQKIEGKTLENVSRENRNEAQNQFREQILKVLKQGICPIDSFTKSNSLFNEKERKLYLIDLENWKIGDESELNSFYRLLSIK